MIIGNFTDLHARADNPEGRTDNFRNSLMIKLEEVGQIWKDNKVDLVTFTGDLFNTPDPASSVRNDVLRILKSWGLPIIGVVGSHDYFGYQMKTLNRTALGSAHCSGVMDLVGGAGQPECIPFFTNNNKQVIITGTPHTYWATDDPDYINKSRFNEGVFQIQLVHYDLIHKKVPWPHTLISDVKTESDLVFVGHYHPGWEQPIVQGNTTFVNQGSIGRLERSNVQRTPRVAIVYLDDTLTVDKDNSNNFKLLYVSLETALEHPFSAKITTEEEEYTSQDVNRLIQMIESSEIDVVDIKNALPKVAKEFNYNTEVLDKAFEFLEQVNIK